jgi:uncharacterized protein YegJ (DUF2314 family)
MPLARPNGYFLWVCLALFAGGVAGAVLGISRGLWVFVVGGVAVCVAGAALWRRRVREQKPLISLVLLLRHARGLNRKMLAENAKAAWRAEFGTDENEGVSSYVAGESPVFFVSYDRVVYMVHNHHAPYFDDSEKVAAAVNELRLSSAIREHTAWMAVDFMGGERIANAAEAYPEIAKLVAELGGPDCVAIFCPETGAINLYDSSLEEKLRGPDPLSAVTEPLFAPVVSIAEDDPRMVAAVAEAQQRWPEFVEAFENRRGQNFAIKAPVTKGGQKEFIWITVNRIEGNLIHGTLDNDPLNPDLKAGDAIKVPLQELNDWAYSVGENSVGPFTLKVLQAAVRESREG